MNEVRDNNKGRAAAASKQNRQATVMAKRGPEVYQPDDNIIDSDQEEEKNEDIAGLIELAAEHDGTRVETPTTETLARAVKAISRRVVKMEAASLIHERMTTANAELAVDGFVAAQEAMATAVGAQRQSCKVCLVLSGSVLKPRSRDLEDNTKQEALRLMEEHLGLEVHPDELLAAHYRQPRTKNEIIAKFGDVSDTSAYSNILKTARQKRPKGFWVKIMEAPKDSEAYYLLRTMRRAGEAEAVHTARSGKPAAKVRIPGATGWEIKVFENVEAIREIMGKKSKDLEEQEDVNRLATRRNMAQEAVRYKQRVKQVYQGIGRVKINLRAKAEIAGNGPQLTTVDRVDLELAKQKAVKKIGKSRADRGKGFKVVSEPTTSANNEPLGTPANKTSHERMEIDMKGTYYQSCLDNKDGKDNGQKPTPPVVVLEPEEESLEKA